MATHTLYNAGDRIKEILLYSVKASDKEVNWMARREIDAPEHAFFTLEDEVQAPQQGSPRIPVYFHQDIVLKHGHRGVILIDPDCNCDADDDQPYAKTKDEAREKGDRLWHNHLVNTVHNHINLCADVRANGGAPRAASNFTRRAFKLLKLQDPGTIIFQNTVVGAAPAEKELVPKEVKK